MRRSTRIGAWVIAALLAAVSAHAQDDVRTGSKRKKGARYEINLPDENKPESKAGDKPSAAPDDEPEADPKLASALADKIAVCYQEETKKPLQESDRKLVAEYQHSLVFELARSLREIGCSVADAPDATCLSGLKAVTCEDLARAIKAKRWDKHLVEEDRKAIAAYTGRLTKRKAACREARGIETTGIEQQIESDKLGVLAAANLAVGRCVIQFENQAACEKQVDDMSCAAIEDAERHNQLLNQCPKFIRCKSVGVQ